MNIVKIENRHNYAKNSKCLRFVSENLATISDFITLLQGNRCKIYKIIIENSNTNNDYNAIDFVCYAIAKTYKFDLLDFVRSLASLNNFADIENTVTEIDYIFKDFKEKTQWKTTNTNIIRSCNFVLFMVTRIWNS